MASLHYRHYPAKDVTDAVNLVLVHGWGLSGAVWHSLLSHLKVFANVTVIHRSGYGGSDVMLPQQELDALLTIVPERAVYIGWSLGFAAVTELAIHYPQRVQALVAVAANPCFVERSDWPSAMPIAMFQQFRQQLLQDAEATLKRFIALQCHGSISQKQDIRHLNSLLAIESMPSLEVLLHGLQQLADQDLRPALAQLTCPVLWMLGQKDALVPFAVGADLITPNLSAVTMPMAAHVPHLSHPEKTAGHIQSFVQALHS